MIEIGEIAVVLMATAIIVAVIKRGIQHLLHYKAEKKKAKLVWGEGE